MVRFTAEHYLKWILVIVILCVPLQRILLLRVSHLSEPQITGLVGCRADALAIGMLAAALARGEDPVFSVAPHARKLYATLGALSIGIAALWLISPQASTFGVQSFGYTWMALFYGGDSFARRGPVR